MREDGGSRKPTGKETGSPPWHFVRLRPDFDFVFFARVVSIGPDPEGGQESVLFASEFLVFALALEQAVQFHALAPQQVIFLDERLNDPHELARLRLIRPRMGARSLCRVRVGRGGLPRLEERERVRAAFRAQDLVLPHLFEVGACLPEAFVEVFGAVVRFPRARLGGIGALSFRREVFERIGVRDLELLERRRDGDESARVVREPRDGLAVLFERDEQGAVRRIGLVKVPERFFQPLRVAQGKEY